MASSALPADLSRGPRSPPIWACSRPGLPCPQHCCRGGGLLPRRFTLTIPRPSFLLFKRRFKRLDSGLFSVALSLSFPDGRYPWPCPVEAGLSSADRFEITVRRPLSSTLRRGCRTPRARASVQQMRTMTSCSRYAFPHSIVLNVQSSGSLLAEDILPN